MSIRLNKAIRELNIGIQTASEFLGKNYGIDNADPNLKLTDEQYSAMKAEFSTDAEVRSQAEQMLQKKDKKADKKESTTAAEPVKTEQKDGKQTFNVLGKIDLDQFKKPAKSSKGKAAKASKPEQPKPVKAETVEAPAPKPAPVEEKPEPADAPVQKEVTAPAAPAVAESPAPAAVPAPETKASEAKEAEKPVGTTDNGVFRLEHNK
ncbi:MAG: translation initiation factor IF-2, partial [Prevotella sp.]|nr:translation initiation factor IF-2 [Prevotella sp.]